MSIDIKNFIEFNTLRKLFLAIVFYLYYKYIIFLSYFKEINLIFIVKILVSKKCKVAR